MSPIIINEKTYQTPHYYQLIDGTYIVAEKPLSVTTEIYTEQELAMMERGRTITQAIEEQGCVYQCDEISYPQAISQEHAEKMHRDNFDCTIHNP